MKQESEFMTALSRRAMLLFGSGLAAVGLGGIAALDVDAKKRKRRRRKNKKRKKKPGQGSFTVVAPDMTGAKEVPPESGDPTGQGSATCTIKGDEICCDFTFTSEEDDEITGIHIHEGPPGEDGDIVVPFSTALEDNCVNPDDPSILAQIKTNPSDFYMNIHTAAHDGGAVRDQLQAG